jgi:hypothetical protein
MATKQIPFYNVSHAVGPGAPNRTTDVELVQFFLREIYDHPSNVKKKPAGTMTVDGVAGPITFAWIRRFQEDVKRAGGSVLVDGRVDHARGRQFDSSSISRTGYTIAHMNMTYRRRYGTQHDYLDKHPRIPPALKAEIRE